MGIMGIVCVNLMWVIFPENFQSVFILPAFSVSQPFFFLNVFHIALPLTEAQKTERIECTSNKERERESEVVFRGGRDVILGCRCCKSSRANNTITMQHGNPFPLLSLQPANTWTGDSDAQIWQPYSIFPPNSTVSVFIKREGGRVVQNMATQPSSQ